MKATMKATMRRMIAIVTSLCLAGQPMLATAEDIDIFVGDSAGAAGDPNVLFVLDNTSNWSRQSQKWPGGEQQGQAEVDAIKTVINSIDFSKNPMNIGLMEFVTQGTANDNGGFVRFAMKPMSNASNKTDLTNRLTTIYNNINDPAEKRNSGEAYGNLLYDVYNYLSGRNQSQNGAGTPTALADASGYDAAFSKFKAPLSCDTNCAKTFMIFISNPDQSGPTRDDAPQTPGNTATLAGLGGNTAQMGLPNFTTTTVTNSTEIGTTQQCYTTAEACTAAGVNAFAPYLAADCNNTSIYPNGCSCGAAASGTPSCAAGSERFTVKKTIPAGAKVTEFDTNQCYVDVGSLPTTTVPKNYPSNKETSSCPAGTTAHFVAKNSTGCNPKTNVKYTVQCKQTTTTTTDIGLTDACYASAAACTSSDSQYAAQCQSPYTCSCGTPSTPLGTSCPAGQSLYKVMGNSTTITNVPTGTSTPDTAPYNADEWARFLFQKGIKFPGCEAQPVITYTIDVYNAQPNATHTALMLSMARAGGGKYFQASNKEALVKALKEIFSEIMAVNSTFASASLPVNATNRAQNENQVFIGMFRPNPGLEPRWFGNLKRYQVVKLPSGVDYDLGDKNGVLAVNPATGFITECAQSWWTSDSPIDPADLSKGYYWANQIVNPSPISTCATVTGAAQFSDNPDGPKVEKGAVAEVLRKGNNPPGTDSSPTWAVNRTIYTTTAWNATTLADISSASLSETQKKWVKGEDTQDEDIDANKTEVRASVHGDVVHSRPLPVNYGGGNIVVYYGSNDGQLRAVDAATGKEHWSFMPFEFAQASFVDRLRNNTPKIAHPNIDPALGAVRKTYGWDGGIGLAQNLNNSKVWIYPTQRRGGQLVYGLNVTNPAAPSIMWKHGCYGGSCTTGFGNMGQSWSTPNVAYVAGYATEKVAFFGGGYDTCEDADTATPPCSSPRGANVYAVDAGSGALLKSFGTTRSVAADVALVDVNSDAKADYVYVADTGGDLYRIDLVSYDATAKTYTPRAPADWTIRKIARAGGNRKFLFAPALMPLGAMGKVYVAIGSGDREHPLQSNYAYNITNRFYVYLDDLSVTSGDPYDLNNTVTGVNVTTDPGCGGADVLPGGELTSWFMDLNQYGQGEQTVTTALIHAGMIAFSTNRPIPPAQGSCSTPLGEARGYWVSLTKGAGAIGVGGTCGGTRSGVFVGGGMPPSPVTGVVPVDGKPVTVVIGTAQRSGTGASTPITVQKLGASPDPLRKRVYWKTQGIE